MTRLPVPQARFRPRRSISVRKVKHRVPERPPESPRRLENHHDFLWQRLLPSRRAHLPISTPAIASDMAKPGVQLQPEELAHRVDLQEYVPAVGCYDDVDRAVVEIQAIHKVQELGLHVARQIVLSPSVDKLLAFASPAWRSFDRRSSRRA